MSEIVDVCYFCNKPIYEDEGVVEYCHEIMHDDCFDKFEQDIQKNDTLGDRNE